MEQYWAITPDALERHMHTLRSRSEAMADSDMNCLPKKPEQPYRLVRGVAVISITGTITRTNTFWSHGQDSILSALDAALADTSARAILLSFDSPGGVVAGTQEVACAIEAACRRKPCAAYADGLCASAAYWMASATGRVLAPPTAQVGSIGVLMVHTDASKMYADAGIKLSYLASGRHKADGAEGRPLDDGARDNIMANLYKLHDMFRADVARRMNISAEPVAWAEGQTLLAADALRVGLVSEIVRDMNEAISQLSGEGEMTREELMAQAPELARALMDEGREQARTEYAGRDAQGHEALLALVSAVAGQNVAEKVKQLAALHFSPEQLAAMQAAGMFASMQSAGQGDSGVAAAPAAMQSVLEELKAAHGQPLPGAVARGMIQKNRLSGAVSRIAGRMK